MIRPQQMCHLVYSHMCKLEFPHDILWGLNFGAHSICQSSTLFSKKMTAFVNLFFSNASGPRQSWSEMLKRIIEQGLPIVLFFELTATIEVLYRLSSKMLQFFWKGVYYNWRVHWRILRRTTENELVLFWSCCMKLLEGHSISCDHVTWCNQ